VKSIGNAFNSTLFTSAQRALARIRPVRSPPTVFLVQQHQARNHVPLTDPPHHHFLAAETWHETRGMKPAWSKCSIPHQHESPSARRLDPMRLRRCPSAPSPSCQFRDDPTRFRCQVCSLLKYFGCGSLTCLGHDVPWGIFAFPEAGSGAHTGPLQSGMLACHESSLLSLRTTTGLRGITGNEGRHCHARGMHEANRAVRAHRPTVICGRLIAITCGARFGISTLRRSHGEVPARRPVETPPRSSRPIRRDTT
jgi:hypothetical protein